MTMRNAGRMVAAGLALAALGLGGCAPPAEEPKPRLLLSLPDDCNTPDGMTLDPATNVIYLSCPNFNEKDHPGKLMKITPDNQVEECFMMPKHPDTGYACPMGLDLGPDGHLYVADNQYFYDKNCKSRLIRVVLEGGRAVRAEVAVDGFKLSNAVVWKDDLVFVSDTFFDLADRPGSSGIYRFTLEELKRGMVKLQPPPADPHLIATLQTQPLEHRQGELAGADGLTIDGQGNLYTGNFGDGAFHRIALNSDGSAKEVKVVHRAQPLTCVDGIFWDAKRDVIYIADSEKNAIQVYHVKTGQVTTLWENGDTDGSDGLLDQPCEPLVRGSDLIIVNFDMPFPGLKNKAYDKPHTICVIKLK